MDQEVNKAATQPKSNFIKSFSRTGGRGITEVKTKLIQDFLPTITIERSDSKLSADAIFPGKEQLWFEIGFGSGEHVIHQATSNPDCGIIGCEVYMRAFSTCLKQVHDQKLDNVKLYNFDARELLERFEDEQVDRIFVLFPDPWPKKRHIKRRLINKELLAIFWRVLKHGGKVRVATDHATYRDHTLETFNDFGKFKPAFTSIEDLTKQPDDHIITRYQVKNLAKAKQAFFMDFTKQKITF